MVTDAISKLDMDPTFITNTDLLHDLHDSDYNHGQHMQITMAFNHSF